MKITIKDLENKAMELLEKMKYVKLTGAFKYPIAYAGNDKLIRLIEENGLTLKFYKKEEE